MTSRELRCMTPKHILCDGIRLATSILLSSSDARQIVYIHSVYQAVEVGTSEGT